MKKSVTVSDSEEENSGSGPAADGAAVVGGVEGYYVCDGGCDRATVTNAYAHDIIKAGGHFEKYADPLLATLANGETTPIISGYLLADLEVVTSAGKVVLPKWHIDVIEGPTSDRLLYLGQREEAELNLKTFQEQLTEVARKRQKWDGRAKKNRAVKGKTTSTQVCLNGTMRTVTFVPGSQPKYKRKLSKSGRAGVAGRGVCEDVKLFVNADGWEVQREIKYIVDPRLPVSYVTTAALANQEVKLEGRQSRPVRAHEISPEVAEWLGAEKVQYGHTVRTKLYVLPDDQLDVVRKLTILPNTIVRVIDSPVAAIAAFRMTGEPNFDREKE